MTNKTYKKALCMLLMIAVISGNAGVPGNPVVAIAAGISGPATSATGVTGVVAVDFGRAAVVAEKMYYCGELYIFTESMMKTNFEMATIAANLKDQLGSTRVSVSNSILNNIVAQYNTLSDKYNSWVEVRPNLEKNIGIIDNSRVYNVHQLQLVYRNTLTTINLTRALLELVSGSIEDASSVSKTEIEKSIDTAVKRAAGANRIIEPYLARSLSGYRSYFDEFSKLAGIQYDDDDNDDDGES